jgi:hypothetical protein
MAHNVVLHVIIVLFYATRYILFINYHFMCHILAHVIMVIILYRGICITTSRKYGFRPELLLPLVSVMSFFNPGLMLPLVPVRKAMGPLSFISRFKRNL